MTEQPLEKIWYRCPGPATKGKEKIRRKDGSLAWNGGENHALNNPSEPGSNSNRIRVLSADVRFA